MTEKKTCNTCRCNKVCDHNKFGFENCGNYIPLASSVEFKRKKLIDLICKANCDGDESFFNCPERRNGQCRTITSLEMCQVNSLVDHLLANGVIVLPCKVGDKVYALLEDDFPVHKWYLSEEIVTDVSVRGLWLSGVVPAQDDHGVFCEWSEVGVEIFLSCEDAEKALKGVE